MDYTSKYTGEQIEGLLDKVYNLPEHPEENVNPDWNQTDPEQPDYIKNKPQIPTKTSDLENDSGFLTEHQSLRNYPNRQEVTQEINQARPDLTPYDTKESVNRKIEQAVQEVKQEIPEVPTKVSELENDAGYLTQHQDISGKVDVVPGKELSSNDFTDQLKQKLEDLDPEQSPLGAGNAINISQDKKINVLVDGTTIEVDLNNQLHIIDPNAANVQYTQQLTVKDALDQLFYVNPVINSFSHNKGVVEVGDSVTIITFNWAVNKTMQTMSIDQGVGPVIGTSKVYNPVSSITSSKTFTLTVDDGVNSTTKSTTISFLSRMFWFPIESESVDAATILGHSSNSQLVSSRGMTKTFDCSGGKYIYFCIPTSLCSSTVKFVSGGLTTSFQMTSMQNFVNSKGVIVPMNIYRSVNKLNGSSITVTVS